MKRIALVVIALLAVGLFVAHQIEAWPFGPKWVQIFTADGEPIMGAVLALPETGFQNVTSRGNGWLKIPRDKLTSDAEMMAVAPGCAVLRGPLPSGRKITLPPGLPVTIKVPGDFPLPEAPLHLEIALAPADADRLWAFALESAVVSHDNWQRDWDERDGSLLIDPGTRSVMLLMPRTGRWRVHWSVMHYKVERSGGQVTQVGSGQGPDESIVIDIPEGATEVALPLDAASIAKYVPQ